MTPSPRPSWDETWLTVAHAVARRSLCTRDRVGAVIVDPRDRIVATGYNGPPTGFYHGDLTCDKWCRRAGPRDAVGWVATVPPGAPVQVLRVESGKIFFGDTHCEVGESELRAAGYEPTYEPPAVDYSDCPSLHAELNALSVCDRSPRERGTIYVTSHVCYPCAKVIANSGLARVVVCHRPGAEHRRASTSYEFITSCLGANSVTVYDDDMRILTRDTFEVRG